MRHLVCLFCAVVLSACSQEATSGSHERRGILVAVADAVVVPRYTTLGTQSAALHDVVAELCSSTPTPERLSAAQNAWVDMRKAWAACEAFGFGPIADTRIDKTVDFLPPRIADIQDELGKSNTVDAAYVANLGSTRKGLTALEYVLFSDNALTELADTRRCAYSVAVAQDMDTHIQTLASAWTNGYRDAFANAGNNTSEFETVQDALDKLVNQLIFVVQKNEGDRVALPIGKRNNGSPQPQSVGSYYSGASLEEIRSSITGVQSVYLAETLYNGTNTGFSIVVRDLNPSLDDKIKAQFTQALSVIDSVPESLSEAVSAHDPSVENLYASLKVLLNLIGVDLASQLAITTTFSTNDGD